MRKNLFLTLALALASFAGAAAQDYWAVTLGATEGLPGVTVFKDGGNIKYYKSGIIKADKPIKSLRLTCAGNSTNHKPNGNNFRLMLSELNVYSADNMKEELNYTVTTNADHNLLARSFDGQGLKALYDGKYDNFFSSMSAAENAEKGIAPVTDFHYLELTFEEEIERFIIEWGGKQGSGEVPSVVGLTEGGVAYTEPYVDRPTSFSEEKITSLEALKAAKHFTIRGNAPTEYHTYNNQTGDKTSKDPVAGSGPIYVTLGDTYAEAPTMDYLAQLVDAGEGAYYIYFPIQKKYLSNDGVQNAFNGAYNGWQYATADITKAAKVNFIALDKGDFEMTYYCEKGIEGGEEFDFNDIVYIGADPRTGKMKIFAKTKKEALERQGWCEGFGLVCTFNWSFYPAEYTTPAWAKEYEIGSTYVAINELQNAVNNTDLTDVLESLEETMQNIDDMDESEVEEAIADAQSDVAAIIKEIASDEMDNMEDQWDEWKRSTKSSYTPSYYPSTSYAEYIEPGVTLFKNLKNISNKYECIAEITEYFTNKSANIKAFEASKYEAKPMPFEFAAKEGAEALGELVNNNQYVWQQSIGLAEKVNGFRITFVETNVGNAAGGGKYNGYPMVALGELEIYDGNGEKIELIEESVRTNSQETSEGQMLNLVDGDNATFWHSIWGNGAMNPVAEVYLDIKLPGDTELDIFDIKIVGRNNKSLSPKRIVFSKYETAYNETEESVVENPYNVAIGKQITDLAQLKDGGLYAIQGNLRVNKENPSEPRFYAGIEPTATKADKLDETNVYMFKKAGDCWNILSLSNGKYWTTASGMLTVYANKAEDLKLVSSENIENTWVIYSEIDTVLSSNYTHEGVKFDSVGVNVKAQVFMDWDGSLASRPCYSPLPGVADPRFTQLTDEMKVESSCGDYLHYNKTNGEGEWNIYEVTMNDEYFVYLTGLVNELENLKLTPGEHPGCIKADSATTAKYQNAKAAAKVAVKRNRKSNAEALVTELIEAMNTLANSERVGFEADAVYRIESALPNYKENTWYTRSVYADEKSGILKWTVTPDNFEGENEEFLFNIIPVTEEVKAEYVLEVEEANFGKVFIIKLADQEIFAGKWDESKNEFNHGTEIGIYHIDNLESRSFTIKENGKFWHTEGHNNGNGYEGRLVQYDCGNNLNSASSWKFINNALPDYEEVEIEDVEDDESSIENLVVEGDEVVSVCYFTPAGTAISAPVKGLNIVVTVYANGVIEAKKKLVK